VKIFSQNSLIPIQVLNGFFIFYDATWDGLKMFQKLTVHNLKPWILINILGMEVIKREFWKLSGQISLTFQSDPVL
jgi:hypothetical protein